MADLAAQRAAIESAGAQVALVHMSGPDEADAWLARLGASELVRVSDPDKSLYRQFGLQDAALRELAHPRVWWPWFRTAILQRRGFGAAGPNWRQLTGAFVLFRGRLLAAVRHRNSAARPDYLALVRGAQPGATIR